MRTPRRTRTGLCTLLGLACMMTALAGPVSAASAAQIKLGIFNSGTPADPRVLDEYAAMVGRKPDIVLFFRDFGHKFLNSSEISSLRARGQTPLLTWEPLEQSLSQIAAGTYDSYLRESARIAKTWSGELMVRFAHEMNAPWFAWGRGVGGNTSSGYIEAWRHIVSIFRAEGATNVRFVWSPNVDRSGSMPIAPYFPGESWVDYVALDGYNWGTPSTHNWSSMEDVFASSYATVTQLSSKPVIIAETGSSERGGDKAAWIREGFMRIIPQRFPRVQAVVWFNLSKEDDWRINSSQASLDAYRAVVSCAIYGGTGPCDPGTTVAGGSTGATTGSTTGGKKKKRPLAVRALRVTARVPAVRRGKVSYRLSQQATVRIKIQRRFPGGGFKRRAALTRRGGARRTRLGLSKLVRGRALRSGSYRVVIVARDREGRRSRARRAHFRIV